MNLDDSAEARIARLDAALARRGEDIIIRRVTLGPNSTQIPFNVEGVRARVKALDANELVNGVDQTWSRVILSPTQLTAAHFPLPIRKGDKAVIGGAERNIEFPKPFVVDDVLVRIELMVAG